MSITYDQLRDDCKLNENITSEALVRSGVVGVFLMSEVRKELFHLEGLAGYGRMKGLRKKSDAFLFFGSAKCGCILCFAKCWNIRSYKASNSQIAVVKKWLFPLEAEFQHKAQLRAKRVSQGFYRVLLSMSRFCI